MSYGSGFQGRTSIAQNIRQQRRNTERQSLQRESDGSLNNRGSNINSEEGSINVIQPPLNAGRGLPNRSDEEFKCSEVVVGPLDSDSPSSGNGHTRQPLGSFIKLGDEEKDPFLNNEEPAK